MSSISRELVFLVLQFLDEEKLKETVHKLEQESGFFFNMKYFEDEVHNGNWDEVERYLSGFTKVDDNRSSMKIYFEIIKQKDLEALYKENELLSKYGDTKSARTIMLVELKKLIEANPLLCDKLKFPNLKNSRLRTLINQSLNWQHQLCKSPSPNPDIKTLFADHTCGQPNGVLAPSPANNPLLESIPKAGVPPLGAHGPFQPTPAPVPTPLVGWMSNPSIVAHPAVSGGAIGLGGPTNPEDLRLILLRLRSSTERKKEKEINVAAMSSLSRELVFLILQFLNEEKLNETVHELEQESGFFFNMKYFEDEVHNGNWDEVERYLSGFTKVDDNSYSMKIFLEIIKQKDLEALDKENEPLFKYGDTKSARTIMLVELKKLIEANPLFRDKLQFPNLKNSRLRTLINQSLNWQHQLCRNPRPNPDIKTLFADHTCGQPNGALAPSPANNPLLGSIPKARGFPPLGAHGRRSLTTQQSKKAKTSKDLVLSTARVLFRLVFNLLILLAAFYIYWNLSATITEIRENRTTIKQGISQFVIDAQGLIGWIYDESNSGFNEDRSGGKVGTARRILRFVG